MARARNIKPGFFKNETLAELSPLTRLLFVGLWCIADRNGRLEDRPKRIRAEVLPYDDGSVDDMLNELQRAEFILRYEAEGQRFIQVLNFGKHQTPHHKEVASTIPAPDVPRSSPNPAPDMPKCSRSDSLNLIPSTLIPDSLIPDTGLPSKDLSPPSASTKKGTALSADWKLPKAWGEWALSEKPELKADDIRRMADTFKDHWLANANRATGKKADWLATWRNWVRNSKAAVGVQFQTADQRRIASTDKSIAEWLGEGNGNVIEGECHAG